MTSGGDGLPVRLELPGQAIGLLPTLPYTRRGIVALLEQGAVMHWPATDGLIELDRDMASPMGAFVPGGPLVLISGAEMTLLDVDTLGVRRVTRSGGVRQVTRSGLKGASPVGVSGTDSPGEFAVLESSGRMNIYRVPR